MAIVLTKDQKVVNGQFIKIQNDAIKYKYNNRPNTTNKSNRILRENGK